MRFGKTLQDSTYKPWEDKYIDYRKLKKLLREDQGSSNGSAEDVWTEADEENFVQELVNVQLEKVNQHQAQTSASLRDQTSALEAKLQSVAGEDNQTPEDEKKATAKGVLKELDTISAEINELKRFSRINYTGFLKAAKKHDRKRGHKYRVRPLLLVRLAQTPFNTEDYSPLLYRLSAMYTWSRQMLEGENVTSRQSNTSVRPKDSYTAFKFWVHADNLLEVKTYLLRRLPVLVYNPQSMKVVDSSKLDPTITSIYFDNPKFDLYKQKVEKTGAAASLRLRWTGQLSEKPEIVLEKKVVSDTASSNDIRIRIKEKYVGPFIKGEYKLEKQIKKLEDRHGADSEQVKSLQSNVDEIQSFIQKESLEPMLRATYTRTAFQIPGDDRVRVSIDTNLALIREDSLDANRPCRDPDDWHRTDIEQNELEYPYSSIRTGEISRFEHAILEIKVKDSAYTRSNAWLADLMSSHLVTEAPKFSKFVHGMAMLFEDYVNQLPFWLSILETDIRRDPQAAFKEEQDKLAKQSADEFAVGSYMPNVGSPSFRAKVGSPHKFSESPAAMMSRSVQSRRSQLQTTLEEPNEQTAQTDEDEDIEITDSSKPSGLRSLFPEWSNSRYARRRREGREATQRAWEDAPLPPGVEKPAYWIKDQGPLKVEAKVWLANQRTFIKWQHIAVLLGTLSLGLYNAAGVDNDIARSLAAVYTLFAVFAGAWGWAMYMWRSKLITERSGKDFDNMWGPFIVSMGLAVALLLNFGFKYRAVMAERDREGGTGGGVNGTTGGFGWQIDL